MKAFSFSFFLEKADIYLSTIQTMWFQDNTKRIDDSLELDIFEKRLSSAKIIALAHNELPFWFPKLLFYSTVIQPRIFVLCTTDIAFNDDDLQGLLDAFPNTHFLVTNYVGKHPRCILLPLGNMSYDETVDEVKKVNICITYCTPNSKDREEFYSFLQANPIFQDLCVPPTYGKDYNRILSQSLFSVCPCGNGYDTYRFWESLCNKSIPIVKRNIFFDTLKHQYPNLPFISIDAWTDMYKIISTLTAKSYTNIWNKSDCAIAFTDYWQVKLSELANIP
jgi:hypothetical protein